MKVTTPILPLLFLLPYSSISANSASYPIKFNFPLKCSYDKDCFIQNYFDASVNNQAHDYRCGNMTYNGHTGTDIRIKSLVTMQAGVDILAAASGTVHAIRNNMTDRYLEKRDRARLNPVGLGNAVIIDHDNGWRSIYGHMKKGSVKVKKGDQVSTGTVIGQIGLSGLTEFPHLHFGVKYKGTNIDPFTASKASGICGNTIESLWADSSINNLAYRQGYVLDYGFSGSAPKNYKDVETGKFYRTINSEDHTLFFWTRLVGTIPNDSIELKLYSTDNHLIKAHRFQKVSRYKAQQVVYIGVKKKELKSPVGKAQINVWRNQALYINKTISMD